MSGIGFDPLTGCRLHKMSELMLFIFTYIYIKITSILLTISKCGSKRLFTYIQCIPTKMGATTSQNNQQHQAISGGVPKVPKLYQRLLALKETQVKKHTHECWKRGGGENLTCQLLPQNRSIFSKEERSSMEDMHNRHCI